jgi:transposase
MALTKKKKTPLSRSPSQQQGKADNEGKESTGGILLEKEIEITVAKKQTQLTTIPGVSAVVAGTILGETVEYHKDNPDPRSLLAYTGLEPRIRESGKWSGTMKMSKRGSPYLRQAITIAALYAAYHEPMFEKIYKNSWEEGN